MGSAQKHSLNDKNKHERHEHNIVIYKCDICRAVLVNRDIITSHLYVHIGYKPYKCAKCTMAFASKNSLCHHMESHKPTYEIDNTDAVVANKPNNCLVCGKEFLNRKVLRCHQHIHSAKRHQCLYYDKTFITTDYLKRHTKYIHAALKLQYQCERCLKTFKNSSNKRVHVRLVHEKVK